MTNPLREALHELERAAVHHHANKVEGLGVVSHRRLIEAREAVIATLSSTAPVASEPEAIAQLRHLCEDLIVKYQDGGLDRYMIADGKGLLFSNMASACIRLLAAPQTPSPVAPEPAREREALRELVAAADAHESWCILQRLKPRPLFPDPLASCSSVGLVVKEDPERAAIIERLNRAWAAARAALAGDQAEKDQA